MTFEAWLATFRLDEPDEGGQVGTPVAGAMDFFREVYERRGPVSSDELRAAWQAREVELAGRAVPLVLADIRRTTDLDPHVEVRVVEVGADWEQPDLPGVTAITYNGGYTTEPLSIRMPEIICDVADNLRDHVVDDLWTVWPVCPRDRLGLDPRVVAGRAVWYCRVGEHLAAPIGELTARR